MVAASLLHYLRGRYRILVWAAILVASFAGLSLLACAVFANGLTTDPLRDGQLLAPFRWFVTAGNIG